MQIHTSSCGHWPSDPFQVSNDEEDELPPGASSSKSFLDQGQKTSLALAAPIDTLLSSVCRRWIGNLYSNTHSKSLWKTI